MSGVAFSDAPEGVIALAVQRPLQNLLILSKHIHQDHVSAELSCSLLSGVAFSDAPEGVIALAVQ
ncbi:hypothetical protein Tco_1358736, partial [Tanacetum coccineum]